MKGHDQLCVLEQELWPQCRNWTGRREGEPTYIPDRGWGAFKRLGFGSGDLDKTEHVGKCNAIYMIGKKRNKYSWWTFISYIFNYEKVTGLYIYEITLEPIQLCVYVRMLSYVQLFVTPQNCSQPWNFPGKNTGVGCHFLLQGIFLIQGSNPRLLCLLHWQVGSLPLLHMRSQSQYRVVDKGLGPGFES